jgi:hypothetical protein
MGMRIVGEEWVDDIADWKNGEDDDPSNIQSESERGGILLDGTPTLAVAHVGNAGGGDPGTVL